MNCSETEEVIHAYLDGELDLVRSLAVEQHLRDCPRCAAAQEDLKSLRANIAAGSLYFNAPAGLERRVRTALRQENREQALPERVRWHWSWNWSGILTPLGAAALALVIALPVALRHSAQDRLGDEIG